MRPLPATPYVYAEWKERTVAFDYHVDVDGHYYSVPHALVGHERLGALQRGHRRGVSSAPARREPRALLPARRAHDAARAHAEVAPGARRVDPEAADPLGQSIGACTPAPSSSTCCAPSRIPSRATGRAWGFWRSRREYGEARLEAASALAVALGQPDPQSVKSILRERAGSAPRPSRSS